MQGAVHVRPALEPVTPADADERIRQVLRRAPHVVRQALMRVRARWEVESDVCVLVDLLAQADGGRYLRPQLAAAAYVGHGGESDDVLDRLVEATQLVHLGLCVHDDVADGDEQRHGQPTIQLRVSRSRWASGDGALAARHGVAYALLAGDLSLTTAMRSIGELRGQLPDSVVADLQCDFLHAVEKAVAGGVLDLTVELREAATRPMRAAELKKASYSLELPLRLGARAAGASDPVIARLTSVGRHLGIAYHLAVDELGVFGDPAETGRPAGVDLRAGKRTELLRHATVLASAADRAFLARAVGDPELSEAALNRVRLIMEQTGARQRVHRLIADHTAAAEALLDEGLGSWLAERLVELSRGLAPAIR